MDDFAGLHAALAKPGARVTSFEPRKIGMDGDIELWEVTRGVPRLRLASKWGPPAA